MTTAEKTLERMRRNPRDWRIEELESLAKRVGLAVRKPGGSHVIFFDPETGNKLSVPARRPIKEPYIRQFLALIAAMEELQ